MRQIKPVNNHGSIQLKFSFGGRRYSCNPIPGADYNNKRDLRAVTAIAVKIENDIIAGCFDPSLDRYRLAPKNEQQNPKHYDTLLSLWDTWTATLDLSEATKANHYKYTRLMILRSDPGLNSTLWFTQSSLAPKTYNDRLSYLRACGKWAVKERLLLANPFELIKPRRKFAREVKPFSVDEMKKIIRGFEVQAPHYLPFVRFLFLTGVRISEAIGLTWSHVDFKRSELTISESLSKDVLGNGYKRVRKETKTGSIRHLTLSTDLRNLLLALKTLDSFADDLVFTSVEGHTISADNFRKRTWAKVLAGCGVPYRKPHAIRHTTLSHAVEQGIPLTGVAYLAGHKNTRMVMETYGHMINRPQLPEMPL